MGGELELHNEIVRKCKVQLAESTVSPCICVCVCVCVCVCEFVTMHKVKLPTTPSPSSRHEHALPCGQVASVWTRLVLTHGCEDTLDSLQCSLHDITTEYVSG
jgi:hypothetical protein